MPSRKVSPSYNRLVRDAVHRQSAPRPTDHRVGARHGCVATLNLSYTFSGWDKPLNVQRGVRVYKKRTTEEPVDDGDAEATVGFLGCTWRCTV